MEILVGAIQQAIWETLNAIQLVCIRQCREHLRKENNPDSRIFLICNCEYHLVHKLDRRQCLARADVCGALLLGSRLQDKTLALAHAGRDNRDCRLDARIFRPAHLPPLFQQLRSDLRISGSDHHFADVVLYHRADAAAWS